jgi:biopolymer transport protein TolQ
MVDPTAVAIETLKAVGPSTSMWDLFWNASFTIQIIMFGLIAASFWSWTIIFQKITRIKILENQADHFEEEFWAGGSLDQLYDRLQNRPLDPLASVFCAAMREWRRSISKGMKNNGDLSFSIQQRIERVMQTTIGREMEDLQKHTGFLASTGATAPFVGLFGTVLGIMESLNSIASQQNANIAVVAPGMSEALFATAIGLVAAIPAVVGYNKISNDLDRYNNRLEAFASEFSAIVSRQLEDARIA